MLQNFTFSIAIKEINPLCLRNGPSYCCVFRLNTVSIRITNAHLRDVDFALASCEQGLTLKDSVG